MFENLFCIFCEIAVSSIACPQCGEYKGVIPAEDAQ